MVLRHCDLPDDDQQSHYLQGWEMYLERLGVLMSGGEPGADPNASRTNEIL